MTADPDLEQLAHSAAAAVAACDALATSPAILAVDRGHLNAISAFAVDGAALVAQLVHAIGDLESVLFGQPAALEAAIRARLTPGQLADLAERLASP